MVSVAKVFQAIGRDDMRPVRFILVGGFNTACGYGIFAAAIWLGAHYALAIAASTVLGTLVNFKTTGVLVFGSIDNARLLRFILVYTFLYAINVVSVALLLKLGLNAYLSGFLMTLPLALLAYILGGRYVFSKR